MYDLNSRRSDSDKKRYRATRCCRICSQGAENSSAPKVSCQVLMQGRGHSLSRHHQARVSAAPRPAKTELDSDPLSHALIMALGPAEIESTLKLPRKSQPMDAYQVSSGSLPASPPSPAVVEVCLPLHIDLTGHRAQYSPIATHSGHNARRWSPRRWGWGTPLKEKTATEQDKNFTTQS
jgi:hypothetical protein